MISQITETHRELKDIPGYEDFEGYAIGLSGKLYSTKKNRLKVLSYTYPGPVKEGRFYPRVKLTTTSGSIRAVYIISLMARAFILGDVKPRRAHLKEGSTDYNIENIHFVKRKKEKEADITLSKDLLDDLKNVYRASIMKGIPMKVKNVNEFVHLVIKEGLNDYISQKGLRKILHEMDPS